MKKSKKVALCGMICGLAFVILVAAYFPYLTFALPSVAGALFMVVLVELDAKWAFGAYVATAILAGFLLPQFESTWLFAGFFGFYPIIKGYLENIPLRIIEYFVKFAMFNVALVAIYFLIKALGMPMEDVDVFGRYTIGILLVLANGMFWMYDLALSSIYREYMKKYHSKIRGILK